MTKLYSTIQKAKSDARTFFINFYHEEDSNEYMDETDIYWIGDGHVLACGDIFVSLEDIEKIDRDNIPRDVFLDHYWHSTEHYEDDLRINLENYVKIRGNGTHEDVVKWLEDQKAMRQTPEYKAKCEENLKKMWKEGMGEMAKMWKEGKL